MWKQHESEQSREPPQKPKGGLANVGRSIVFKGELTGNENLNVDGQVEGKIILRQHTLTVGPTGKVKAEICAKVVIVLGQVTGNITATEKIELREKSSVEGDITAPLIAMAGGAHFRGSIDMRGSEKPVTPEPAEAREPAGSRRSATTGATAKVATPALSTT